MNTEFTAGIVTFNPDIHRLKVNIDSIVNQISNLLIVDNKSKNIDDLKIMISKYGSKITICENIENCGIAYAHNQICEYALKNGYKWAVILDQDSICPSNLISEYRKYSCYHDVGMLCPLIYDINIGTLDLPLNTNGTSEVDLCIASASAIKIQAWIEIGKIYEDYFIDSVDFDICMSLKEHKYKILRINDVVVQHEVGRSKLVKFLWKERQILNHSPIRYYYIFRNAFLLSKRHPCCWRIYRTNMLRFILINIFEDRRFEKNLMIIKGIWHGIIGKYGKYK